MSNAQSTHPSVRALFFITLLVQIYSGVAQGQVSYDGNGIAVANLIDVNSISIPGFQVPAGSDRLLVVAVDYATPASSVTSVEFNGTDLIHAVTGDRGGIVFVDIWYLTLGDGSSETGDINVTLDGLTNNMRAGAVSFQNVDQVATVGDTQYTGGLFQTDSSLSLTTTPDNGVFDAVMASGFLGVVMTPGGSQTEMFDILQANFLAGSFQLATGNPTQMDWSFVESTNMVHSAIEIKCSCNSIIGTPGDDELFGGDGNDTMIGGDGDDDLDGRPGDDVIYGGDTDPDDWDTDDDGLWGDEGDDILIGGYGEDDLDGGSGNDILFGGWPYEIGTEPEDIDLDDDRLIGGEGDDLLYGDVGNDTLDGGTGEDQLFGGDGNDSLKGGSGDDVIDGGEGSDTALFDGDRDDYVLTQLDEDWEIVNQSTEDMDTLKAIENLQFDDGSVSLIPAPVPAPVPVFSRSMTFLLILLISGFGLLMLYRGRPSKSR